ncbi:MAG: YqhA family protein [Bacteroidota bacterium]
MKSSSFINSILKGISMISVIGLAIVALCVIGYATYETYLVIKTVADGSSTEGDVVNKSLYAVDMHLLGIALLIMSIGLFELFISNIKGLPDWLVVKDLDQLKSMLVKVVIVVMSVSFTSKAVTWNGKTELLGFGVGIGAVIFSLSYFLMVKEKTDDSPSLYPNGKAGGKEEAKGVHKQQS